jgi:hypothetical protein
MDLCQERPRLRSDIASRVTAQRARSRTAVWFWVVVVIGTVVDLVFRATNNNLAGMAFFGLLAAVCFTTDALLRRRRKRSV